jgi:hypothetical protein
MSILVCGRPGRRRSRKVHFSATSCRCQRSRVAGVTMGSRLLRAFRPTSLVKVESVRRSASVNTILHRPSRARRARFSAFRYSIRAAACRSSQHAILADSKAKRDLRLRDIDPCYRSRARNTNQSFRTLRRPLKTHRRPLYFLSRGIDRSLFEVVVGVRCSRIAGSSMDSRVK